MSAARVARWAAALSRRSATSMSPCGSVRTGTTSSPAITALAGLVPWAEVGIRHVVRCPSPRERWYARITSSPVNSPCDPALGCSETCGRPVISASMSSSWRNRVRYPWACSRGANGCRRLNSRHERGTISVVALSFMVHEPSGIMDVVSERSRASSRLM